VHRAWLPGKDGSPKFDPQGEFLTAGWRNQIYPLAEKLRITMHQPSHLPQTRLAHEAAAWARQQNRFTAFHQEIFHAYFVEDQDIGNPEALKSIARKLRLDDDALQAVLHEKSMADEVDEDLLIGESYRISSVPAYVIGGEVLSGFQEEEALKAAIRRTIAGEPPPEKKAIPQFINISKR
jgi:predicted DsbA family dithiol-disulfide isomerase